MKTNSIIVKCVTVILSVAVVTVFLTMINVSDTYILGFLLISTSYVFIILMWHFQVNHFAYNVNYDYKEPGFQNPDELNSNYALPSISRLEKQLTTAIENDAIDIYYQKIIDTKTNKVVYIEQLARWNDDELGYIEPNLLFEVAESSNQVIELDQYLINKSIKLYKDYCKQVDGCPKLALNITPETFLHKDTRDFLLNTLKKHQIPHNSICLEIAETTFINDHSECIDKVNMYKKNGFLIALDDFGKSYSSLSILDSINYDVIKIDRLFTHNIESIRTQEIVRMIRNITEMSGKALVIEGVENETQQNFLEKLRCTTYQGFLLHKPEKFN